MRAVKSLKNNKSDEIVNGYIKSTIVVMLSISVRLFNIVFDTGLFCQRHDWLETSFSYIRIKAVILNWKIIVDFEPTIEWVSD